MRNRLKSYAILFFALLTLCAFAMPVFCTPAHAHSQGASVSDQSECGMMTMKKIDAGHKHKEGKSSGHDNCCIGHHCCSAKLIVPVELEIVAVEIATVNLSSYADQFVPSFDASGLERPPKHLG